MANPRFGLLALGFALTATPGCIVHRWVPDPRTLPAVFAGRGPERLRLILSESSGVTLHEPRLSAYGITGNTLRWFGTAAREVHVPLADVRRVERRRVNVPATVVATAVVVPTVAVGVVYLSCGASVCLHFSGIGFPPFDQRMW